jgi:hypothetical protein
VEFKDYYKVMGVARDATEAQIKQAYRKLARKYHPDVSKEKVAQAKSFGRRPIGVQALNSAGQARAIPPTAIFLILCSALRRAQAAAPAVIFIRIAARIITPRCCSIWRHRCMAGPVHSH